MHVFLISPILFLSIGFISTIPTNLLKDVECNWPDGEGDYWPYPGNCSMFIVCTPEGAEVLPCPPGAYWDQEGETCTTDESVCTEGCPDGFFNLSGSSRCYKFYYEEQHNWPAAKSKCEEDGLVIARTEDPVALRRYIVKEIVPDLKSFSWFGARGTGTGGGGHAPIQWVEDGTTIERNNSAWYMNPPGPISSIDHCLILLTHYTYLDGKYEETPYTTWPCDDYSLPFTCELPRD